MAKNQNKMASLSTSKNQPIEMQHNFDMECIPSPFANSEDNIPLAELTDIDKLGHLIANALTHGAFEGIAPGLDNKVLLDGLGKRKNPPLLRAVRGHFIRGLKTFFCDQLTNRIYDHNPEIRNRQIKNDQLFIDHLLNFLPLVQLKELSGVEIPVMVDDKWVLVDYKVVKVPLTTPGNYQETNMVYSYGFEPNRVVDVSHHHEESGQVVQSESVDNAEQDSIIGKAPALLINSGTGFPTADGELTQWFADFFPVLEVGETLWHEGKSRINDWLRTQCHAKRDVHMSGVSLGAGLTMMIARHCDSDLAHIIKRANAIDGARLLFPNINPFSKINKPNEDQDWSVVTQKDDPVSKYTGGYWPKGWTRVKIKLSEEKQKEHMDWLPLRWRLTFNHTSILLGRKGTHVEVGEYTPLEQILDLIKSVVTWPLTVIGRLLLTILAIPLRFVEKVVRAKCDDMDEEMPLTQEDRAANDIPNNSAVNMPQQESDILPANDSNSGQSGIHFLYSPRQPVQNLEPQGSNGNHKLGNDKATANRSNSLRSRS